MARARRGAVDRAPIGGRRPAAGGFALPPEWAERPPLVDLGNLNLCENFFSKIGRISTQLILSSC